MNSVGMDRINAYEGELLDHGTKLLGDIDGVRLIGKAARRAGVLSFVVDNVHPHDMGTALDQMGIAVRTGHHCAQPVMDRYGVPATVRASIGMYNTKDELDQLAEGIRNCRDFFG